MLKFLALIFLFVGACTKKPAGPVVPVDEGRKLYAMHCTACHNVNPKLDGAVGPMVYGSSFELLEAKVLRGEYPAGYTGKRSTKMMARLPFLKDDIPNLHAYLNAP